jgi:hypothetical protein
MLLIKAVTPQAPKRNLFLRLSGRQYDFAVQTNSSVYILSPPLLHQFPL